MPFKFKEFQTSKKIMTVSEVVVKYPFFSNEDFKGNEVFVYDGVLYIDKINEKTFSLTLCRDTYETNNLEELEKKLYRYYIKENNFEFDEIETKCLFLNYKEQPEDLKLICDRYLKQFNYEGLSYKDCENFLKEVNYIGYTFDYELDAEPFNLRKIKKQSKE